ncbi:SDR family oxidoreductase [Deinococcus peraridilitoris]|uniref:Short-chain alcohol dehydrogenase n=1 Tax=Deinococcus peraridilitoris (strain DSM 19664 / LMG 22246 / CIP 109416 / KR-200) TaxID=937777 RepID=L0A6L5_DEIPD|nr:SDR family oxidoreductase [Deinococcus peraridilitoris]AFZ69084.1 short-chain alcohol dehydrogenase [Deinococcus peraridilitoris DSM 19664]
MTEHRKTALITGATGGIGSALAECLASDYHLILAGRDGAKLADLAERFPEARVLALHLDQPASLADAVHGIDRLDALIHNAGVVDLATVEAASLDEWQRTLTINLVAPAELTRLLLPALRAARGHVLFVNSGAGLTANPGWGSYAASKFGLRALADALRGEEAPHGVRVTTVYPGRTATDMQRKVRNQEGGEFVAEAYIRPDSVASTIRAALLLPRDAHLTDLTVRPGS